MKKIITVLCSMSIPVMATDLMSPNGEDHGFLEKSRSLSSVNEQKDKGTINDPYQQEKESNTLKSQGNFQEAAKLLWSALCNENFKNRIARDITRADMEEKGLDLDQLLAENQQELFVKTFVEKAEADQIEFEKFLEVASSRK